MVKGRPWTPATLREVGGTRGIGVAYREETFGDRTPHPRLRLHQNAARAVVQALLPERGTDIKGNMQSYDKLLVASGYARRPQDFEELLRILDGDVRLITPTEPGGPEAPGGQQPAATGERHYQLTHDYLVPSLRDWLARKQKETRRGRAELRLAERAADWNARPESRLLPAWWEWLNIRLLTRKRGWTPPQRRMMRQAGRYYAVRGAALAVALVLATLAIGEEVVVEGKAEHAAALVKRLLAADVVQVPGVIAEMEGYLRWADRLLRQHSEQAPEESRQKLNASLALLPVDDGQAEYLSGRLLKANPVELPVIRDALYGHRDALAGRLWAVLEDGKGDPDRRFRAACALATFDEADRQRWLGVTPFVADRLLVGVQWNPRDYEHLLRTLGPVRDRLVGPLAEVFRSGRRPEADRLWATSILSVYAAGRAEVLADLLLDAEPKQFAMLFPKVETYGERAAALCQETLDRALDKEETEADRERLAKRQANAAVALLRMYQPDKVWPLLRHSPDPRVRSYLIHRLGPEGSDARAIVHRLGEEPDVTIMRALILSLGPEEFGEQARTPGLVERLRETYRTAADPGLHAAAEWLLRQWKQEQWLGEAEAAWAKDREGREKRLDQIRKELLKEEEGAKPRWFVNGQGQTMVVVPGPVEFLMGSPPAEGERSEDEGQHRRRIGRTFAIAAKAVTVRQYLESRKGHEYQTARAPSEDCPVIGTDWHLAACYCNWLSEREGIPPGQWCYETDGRGRVKRLKEGYLGLAGYRLATEGEWEYACRAGALTSRYYGESEELLAKYGWYARNAEERSWPVGLKKPNDLGLFDLHGDVYTWCQESYQTYPAARGGGAIEDKEDKLYVEDTEGRVLRGGSFSYQASFVRCASRRRLGPTNRYYNVGLRPARTFR
jgi:formylglycine-generating enzyme required for sulfatase activity